MLEARPQATHFVPGNLLRAALCLLGPLPLLAQGGPPLLTDDPGTPGNRNWEINFSSTQFWSSTERVLQSPLLDVNYGLGDRIQLKYEVPYLFNSDSGAPFKGGLGNSLLGVKWRFYEQSSEKGWHISTYPQLELNNPTNSDIRQIVNKGPRFLLPIEVAKIFGPVEVNFEGGYWFAKHTYGNQSPRERILGLAFGHQFNRRFEGLCEFYDDVQFDGGRSSTFDVGARYEFRKGLLLLLMAGKGLGRAGEERVSFIGYLGLQVQITHGPKNRRGLRGQAGNP